MNQLFIFTLRNSEIWIKDDLPIEKGKTATKSLYAQPILAQIRLFFPFFEMCNITLSRILRKTIQNLEIKRQKSRAALSFNVILEH